MCVRVYVLCVCVCVCVCVCLNVHASSSRISDAFTCVCPVLRIKPAKEHYERQMYGNLANIVRWVDRNSAQLDMDSSLNLESARHHKKDFITALEVRGCGDV